MSRPPDLSLDALRHMVATLGLPATEAHLAALHEQCLGFWKQLAALEAIDAGAAEPEMVLRVAKE